MFLEYPEGGRLCRLWVQWADSRHTDRETVSNHVIGAALIFVLWRFTSPECSNGNGNTLTRDHITLEVNIIISWARKKTSFSPWGHIRETILPLR